MKFNFRHYWGFPTHIPVHNLSVLHRCHPLISTKMVPGPLQNTNIYHCSTLLYKTKYNLHLPFCIFQVISRLLIKSNKVEMIYTLYHFILFVKLCKKGVCICSDFYKMSSIHDWLDLQIKNLSTEGSFSSVQQGIEAWGFSWVFEMHVALTHRGLAVTLLPCLNKRPLRED